MKKHRVLAWVKWSNVIDVFSEGKEAMIPQHCMSASLSENYIYIAMCLWKKS